MLLDPDDAPEAAAEPCDEAPDVPNVVFNIRLVIPPTIDDMACAKNPNKSEPPP